MADLIPYLISPEKYHHQASGSSTSSKRQATEMSSPSTIIETLQKAPRRQSADTIPATHTSISEKTFDVREFLEANASLIDTSSSTETRGVTHDESQPSEATEPQTIQPRISSISQQLTTFHIACQKKGIVPIFEIEPVSSGKRVRFKGKLKLGEQVVVVGDGKVMWASKKDAKGALAQAGIEIVEKTEIVGIGEDLRNWVGILEEHQSISHLPSPTYRELTTKTKPQAFSVELSIAQHSSKFESRRRNFPTKRLAKSSAAKEAVEWLLLHGALVLDEDGKIKKAAPGQIPQEAIINPTAKNNSQIKIKIKSEKKTVDPNPNPAPPPPPLPLHSALSQPQPQSPPPTSPQTWAQKITTLTSLLSLPQPTYAFSPSSSSSSISLTETPKLALYSGAAFFKRATGTIGPIGEVRNVYGKKAAKQECARGVVDWLRREIERGELGKGKGES
ncbi:hypothetical protein MMC09_004788 [Bachmanniomyces sp. S44760]|nr:hypothetical protein [Bachmanniomyces sp. S44760]